MGGWVVKGMAVLENSNTWRAGAVERIRTCMMQAWRNAACPCMCMGMHAHSHDVMAGPYANAFFCSLQAVCVHRAAHTLAFMALALTACKQVGMQTSCLCPCRLQAENQRLALQLDMARSDQLRLSQSPRATPAGALGSSPAGTGLAGWPLQRSSPPQRQLGSQQWGPVVAAAEAAAAEGAAGAAGGGAGDGAGAACSGPGLLSRSVSDCGVTAAGSAVVVEPLRFEVDQLILIGDMGKSPYAGYLLGGRSGRGGLEEERGFGVGTF